MNIKISHFIFPTGKSEDLKLWENRRIDLDHMSYMSYSSYEILTSSDALCSTLWFTPKLPLLFFLFAKQNKAIEINFSERSPHCFCSKETDFYLNRSYLFDCKDNRARGALETAQKTGLLLSITGEICLNKLRKQPITWLPLLQTLPLKSLSASLDLPFSGKRKEGRKEERDGGRPTRREGEENRERETEEIMHRKKVKL